MSSDAPFFAGVSDPARFRESILRFDELNAADPNREIADGSARFLKWGKAIEPINLFFVYPTNRNLGVLGNY